MSSKSEKKHDKSTKNRNSKETEKNKKDIKVPDKLDLDIDFVDINLSKLFKVI